MATSNEQILFADIQARRFVQGAESSAPVALQFFQGDTHTYVLRGLIPSGDAALGEIYIPAPISYDEMAAGLFAGSADAPPEDGTFKLRYLGEPTGELKWNIGKGELAAALNALASVTAAGGLKVLDKGPAHFYTIQWIAGDPGANIEALEVALSPVCLVRIRKNTAVDGQVLIKLVRAPLAYTEDFEYPAPPEVEVGNVRTGSALRNEIQSLKIPLEATGEFALIWNGTATQVIPVATATAAEIARVLNEVYADGVTRFSVTNPSRRTFYVEFVGPLAKTDHPDLDVEMYSQTAVQAPRFKLPITAEVPVDLELLARKNIPIVFEIAAWTGAEKTVIAQEVVTLINNAIDSQLGLDLAEAGAVQIITNTVYIDSSEGAPITTVSPGATFTPGEPGEELIIEHDLNTFHPEVRVYLKTSDDPLQWTRIPDDEYEAVATSENHVHITGIPMEADPEHEHYFANWKFYVASPDATVELLEHTHPVDQIYRIVAGVPKNLDVILDELITSLPTD